INIDSITKVVCDHFNIAENKIRDKTRKKEIVQARQLAMYLSKEMTNASLKTIGLHFGGRDHSTVIHACTSIENSKENDKSVREMIEDLKNQIELNTA
ncbi:MAG: helix-turn-helix domain-containing protein, partial [Ignavibacteriaceae bacterium]